MSQLKVLCEETKAPWYGEGLPFKCTGCGACCSGAPGYVWVNLEEIEAIAEHLDLTPSNFAEHYLRQVGERWSLKERYISSEDKYDCIFLKEGKCTIYEKRPVQCQTYPWWPENIDSESDWKGARAECEGIDDTAPLTDRSTIEREKKRYLQARRKR